MLFIDFRADFKQVQLITTRFFYILFAKSYYGASLK